MRVRTATSRRALRGTCLAFALVAVACGRLDPEAELAAATESLAARDYGEASLRLNNVVQLQPDNARARKLRGELALLLGDYRRAADELDRARALGAPLDSLALGLADAWTVLGESERALEILSSTVATLAGDPMYWTVQAEALFGAERVAEAEAALEAGDRVGDGGSRAQIARARAAFARNDPLAAEQLLTQALSAAPDDPRLLTARADLFARTDRLTEAANDLLRAADLYRAASFGPREVATLLALVELHLVRNDLNAAEATAARLAQQAPEEAHTAYLQGLVEYRRGRFDEAAALVQPLVSAAPETAQFRALLGVIHLARGNLGQAEQQFSLILASSPRDPSAVKLLAETRLRQQRPEAALAALRSIENAAAQDPQIGLLSGLASLLAGDTEQALVYLEQAAALDPSNELLRLQLARAYLVAGRVADASGLLKGAFEGGAAPLEAALLRLFADIRLGDRDAGMTAAAELLAGFPGDSRAVTAAAIYFQLHGDNSRALELFEQAAELETDGATARLFLAATMVQEGRSQEAERLLARVIEEQPRNAQAMTALAELLTARDAVEEAAELLRKAAEHSASVSPRVTLAELRIRQGDYAAAKRELDAAAAVAPDNPLVVAVLGFLALAEGRAADAVTLLQTAESQLPNRLGVTLALARAQAASGSPDEARATLRRVLAVAPRSLALRVALGETELQLGNAAAVLSIATALKSEFPTQSAGYLLEADAQLAARRYTGAVDSLTTAFAREPTWSTLMRLLGALQLAGRPADAVRASEGWAAANPQHFPGTLTLAGLLQDARRYEEALRAYQAALSLDGNNVIALNNAAWVAQQLARPEALVLAERAYALAADNPAVLDTLGWILLNENREQEAIAHLSRAAELAPNALEIRYHHAEALVVLGRVAEARSLLTTLLEADRDFEQRAEARRLLDSL